MIYITKSIFDYAMKHFAHVKENYFAILRAAVASQVNINWSM